MNSTWENEELVENFGTKKLTDRNEAHTTVDHSGQILLGVHHFTAHIVSLIPAIVGP